MFEIIPHVAEYLAMTGQKDDRDLLSGGDQYGAEFILNELVPRALKERKKIVWEVDPESGPLQSLLYSFKRI